MTVFKPVSQLNWHFTMCKRLLMVFNRSSDHVPRLHVNFMQQLTKKSQFKYLRRDHMKIQMNDSL